MKRLKFLTSLFFLSIMFSCSVTIDNDDEDELGRITASAKGDNPDGTVSDMGFIDLEVTVFDRDGIATVRIEVPAVNVDFVTAVSSFETTQKISQTFNVGIIDSSISKTILVTLMDNDGNTYSKTLAFAIK